MDINDEGALASKIYFSRYGYDESLIKAAIQQGRVWLSPCSIALSQAHQISLAMAISIGPVLNLPKVIMAKKVLKGSCAPVIKISQ